MGRRWRGASCSPGRASVASKVTSLRRGSWSGCRGGTTIPSFGLAAGGTLAAGSTSAVCASTAANAAAGRPGGRDTCHGGLGEFGGLERLGGFGGGWGLR